jgi:galactokinase
VTELMFSGRLTDADDLAAQLAATGLSIEACESKARLFARAAATLATARGPANGRTPLAFFVPGRIEVLGKHTDYAGGRTMVAAAERGFCFVALPRDDRQIVVIDAATGETVVFRADAELTPQAGSWANYPMTVARRVARNFPGATRGADIVLVSDLPPAAGMSSSSALMVGVFLVLSEVNGLAARDEYWHNIGSPTDLAGYLGTVENGQTFGTLEGDRGVGTFGGSEDHTAILCATANHISQYAYCPVEFEKMVPLPPGHVFAIGSSGVAAEKTGAARAKYNTASRLVSTLLEIWRHNSNRDDPHLAAALSTSSDAAERLHAMVKATTTSESLRSALTARLDHFSLESGELIPEAGESLLRGNLRTFGRLVDRSQRAAEQLLGNQVPETVFLAASARQLGAAAASAFGAGFGGSVWALVETRKADDFLASWQSQYRAEFPERAPESTFFLTAAGPAAFRVC